MRQSQGISDFPLPLFRRSGPPPVPLNVSLLSASCERAVLHHRGSMEAHCGRTTGAVCPEIRCRHVTGMQVRHDMVDDLFERLAGLDAPVCCYAWMGPLSSCSTRSLPRLGALSFGATASTLLRLPRCCC